MDIENAILITADEYVKLKNTKFYGQTRADENGDYKMYWECEDKLYYTENNLRIWK